MTGTETCSSCHRREAVSNEKCETCLKFKRPCTRCGRREAFTQEINEARGIFAPIEYGRCEPCLNYAAKWQRKQTENARKAKLCIVCHQPSESARCPNHARTKPKKVA